MARGSAGATPRIEHPNPTDSRGHVLSGRKSTRRPSQSDVTDSYVLHITYSYGPIVCTSPWTELVASNERPATGRHVYFLLVNLTPIRPREWSRCACSSPPPTMAVVFCEELAPAAHRGGKNLRAKFARSEIARRWGPNFDPPLFGSSFCLI